MAPVFAYEQVHLPDEVSPGDLSALVHPVHHATWPLDSDPNGEAVAGRSPEPVYANGAVGGGPTRGDESLIRSVKVDERGQLLIEAEMQPTSPVPSGSPDVGSSMPTQADVSTATSGPGNEQSAAVFRLELQVHRRTWSVRWFRLPDEPGTYPLDQLLVPEPSQERAPFVRADQVNHFTRQQRFVQEGEGSPCLGASVAGEYSGVALFPRALQFGPGGLLATQVGLRFAGDLLGSKVAVHEALAQGDELSRLAAGEPRHDDDVVTLRYLRSYVDRIVRRAAVGVKRHGGNPDADRPVNKVVLWVGTVPPARARPGDLWNHGSKLHIRDDSRWTVLEGLDPDAGADAFAGSEDGLRSSGTTTPAGGSPNQTMSTVRHGDDPGAARPPGGAPVYWVGSVVPGAALDGDQWLDTAEPRLRARWDGRFV